MTPDVSVVITTWNRKRDLLACLDLVGRQSDVRLEVIVVDNASTDGTISAVRAEWPEVRILSMRRNVGIGAANGGVKAARAPFVMLLDNDMMLDDPRCLARAVKALRCNDSLACAAFRIVDDRTGEESGNSPKFDDRFGDRNSGFPACVFDGGAAMVRKDVFLRAGGLPEDFFLYHNEMDLSTRFWQAGWEIRVFPSLVGRHLFSTVARKSALTEFFWTRNYLWYVARYFPPSWALQEVIHFLARMARGTTSAPVARLRGIVAGLLRFSDQRRRGRAAPDALLRMEIIRLRDAQRKGVWTPEQKLLCFWRRLAAERGGFS